MIRVRAIHGTMHTQTSNPNIALVAFDSLGDGLIYLMMAENLRRNGYTVTYYGNLVHQMREWVPHLAVLPYPAIEDLDAALAGYDLVLCSPPSFIRNTFGPEEMQALAQKYVLFCQKAPDDWFVDLTGHLRQRVTPEVAAKLFPLAACSRRILRRHIKGQSIVQTTLAYMKEEFGLAAVDKQISLRPPPGLEYRKNIKRVVISPDSAGPEKKNWSPARFLSLAERLRARGYDPVIVVAPNHRATWRRMRRNIYETPQFERIGELAGYIYESGVLVANDSGNGHLASLLKVPTVTIYRKRNPRFAWRPDWGPGVVVGPSFQLSFNPLNLRVWRPFIPLRAILSHVDRMCG